MTEHTPLDGRMFHRAFREVEQERRQFVAVPDPALIIRLAEAKQSPAIQKLAPARSYIDGLIFAAVLVRAQTIIIPALAWILVVAVSVGGLVTATAFEGHSHILLVGTLGTEDAIALATVACVVFLAIQTSPADAEFEWVRAATAGSAALLAARLTLVLGVSLGMSVVFELVASALNVDGAGIESFLGWMGPAFLSCAVVTLAGLYAGAASASILGVLSLWSFARMLAVAPDGLNIGPSLIMLATGVTGISAALALGFGHHRFAVSGRMR